MAETNTTSTKLSDELQELVEPAFDAKALLQGAMSLLDELPEDPAGDIWATRQLVAKAWKAMDQIYGDKHTELRNRLIEIEEAAA